MKTVAFGMVLAALAAPALGQATEDYDAAVKRLRACITSGVGGAPRDNLAASIAALRALCGHQIRVVQEVQDRRIERVNPAPNTLAEEERLAKLKKDAAVSLNNEIAHLVARLTGYNG